MSDNPRPLLTGVEADNSDEWTTITSSSDSQSILQLARFEGGRMKLFIGNIDEDDYIAISHVWGKTEWLQMSNVDGEKLISRSKAKFVETKLQALVGVNAFWMDTLTVNQKDPEEVIAIVQLIPSIFRNAIRTVAIRENDGFYDCCVKALHGFKDWEDFNLRWHTHVQDTPSHQRHIRTESYLQRLWTLQECLLSHTIQFVLPKPNQPRRLKMGDPLLRDIHRDYQDAVMLSDSLYVLAYSFTGYHTGDGSKEGIANFLRAYIDGGTIARTKSMQRSEADNIYTDNFNSMHAASNRAATESRDYVFATMPQFPWYHYPLDAKLMSFSEIFLDLYEKASRAGHIFACKFARSMTNKNVSMKEAWLPSKEQPDPECLGDFLKLFGQPMADRKPGEVNPIHRTKVVKVIEDLKVFDNSPDELFGILEAAMRFSRPAWLESQRGGELAKYGSYPDHNWKINILDAVQSGFCREDSTFEVSEHEGSQVVILHARGEFVDDDGWARTTNNSQVQMRDLEPGYIPLLEHSRRIMTLMWGGLAGVSTNKDQLADWESFKYHMRGKWSRPLLRIMVLIATMVGCKIGLSALSWVKRRFVPVLVYYGDREKGLILGLLARHTYESSKDLTTPLLMFSVGRHFPNDERGHTNGYCQDLVIFDPDMKVPVGILPDFLPISRSDEMYVERSNMLYDPEVLQLELPLTGPTKFGYIPVCDDT